jgi:hypothetical protein
LFIDTRTSIPTPVTQVEDGYGATVPDATDEQG